MRKMDDDEIIAQRIGLSIRFVERAFAAGARTAEEVKEFFENQKDKRYEHRPCSVCGALKVVKTYVEDEIIQRDCQECGCNSTQYP